MNKYKEIYMSRLFRRTIPTAFSHKNPQLADTVQTCTKAMLELATAANTCYPEDSQLDSEKTAKIMLLDGCFILELLTRWSNTPCKDSIIQNRSVLNNIIHDLLLVENQIPFFVLEKLFNLTLQRIPQDENSRLTLRKLIINFFCGQSNFHFKTSEIQSGPFSDTQVDHILGLVHKCYRPHISKPGDYMITRYSATEIYRSGINLKPSRNKGEYLDIRFKTPCIFSWFPRIRAIFLCPWWLAIFIYNAVFSPPTSPTPPLSTNTHEEHENSLSSVSCCLLSFICHLCGRATLELPELCITDSTESFLRNLIAYEQCSKEIPHYITSYVFVMDTIINTKEHIEMLETSGVLKNYLGSSEVASDLFNSLCTNVVFGDNFYFSWQWKHVDAYYKLYWPSLFGSLRVTYFSSPWTGISVSAALVLFAFTGLQTACTVIQTW